MYLGTYGKKTKYGDSPCFNKTSDYDIISFLFARRH